MKWEYCYLSNTEWLTRVASKTGYKYKFLLSAGARALHREKREKAVAEILNELGAEDWELVSTLPVIATFFGCGGSAGSEMIFKRPRRGSS